jgi:hypothetical protein
MAGDYTAPGNNVQDSLLVRTTRIQKLVLTAMNAPDKPMHPTADTAALMFLLEPDGV